MSTTGNRATVISLIDCSYGISGKIVLLKDLSRRGGEKVRVMAYVLFSLFQNILWIRGHFTSKPSVIKIFI